MIWAVIFGYFVYDELFFVYGETLYNENVKFIISVLKEFNVQNINILVVGLLSNKTSILGCKLIIDSLPLITNSFPKTKRE